MEETEQIEKILSGYDENPRNSLAAMQDMQDAFGYVPRAGIEAISKHCHRSVGELFALSTFYKALSLKPKGKHVIKVCSGTTCHIRGGENIEDGITRELGVEPGDTTDDGEFSLEEVHCVGACALAPVVIVDDDLYGNVTLDKLPEIFGKYRTGADVS
ncbi:MAG: NAD(P)H-dependent oxidoreductase subunit E [Coriobacteriales bacterium]|jgi:NADH:ubiquinone oxidoreductase subunit E